MISWRIALATLAAFGLASFENGHAQENGQAAREKLLSGVERLSFLRGDWDALFFKPTAEGGWKEAGSTAFSMVADMNGLYLETQVQSGPYLYELVFSHDVAQGHYRITSRDDQSGLIDVYEGSFEEGGALVVTNIESGTHYVYGGARYHNRMTFTSEPAGGWSWLVEATSDAGASWHPQIKSVMKRAG